MQVKKKIKKLPANIRKPIEQTIKNLGAAAGAKDRRKALEGLTDTEWEAAQDLDDEQN